MAHSLGNRCAQYFLSWARDHIGQQWIDENIHSLLALGAPFLGAPKAIRTVISGDRMDLAMFLTQKEAHFMTSRSSSLPWLFPLQEERYPDVLARFLEDGSGEGQNGAAACKTFHVESLLEKGAPRSKAYLNSFYLNDNLYLKCTSIDDTPAVLAPPPIQRLWCVYGVNLNTEVSYYYKATSRGLVLDISADRYSRRKMSTINPCGLYISGGIGFETRDTHQPLSKQTISGDGTVPYCSLSFPLLWRQDAKKYGIPFSVQMFEVEGADHRGMLAHEGVFDIIFDLVCERDLNFSPPQSAQDLGHSIDTPKIPIAPALSPVPSNLSPSLFSKQREEIRNLLFNLQIAEPILTRSVDLLMSEGIDTSLLLSGKVTGEHLCSMGIPFGVSLKIEKYLENLFHE